MRGLGRGAASRRATRWWAISTAASTAARARRCPAGVPYSRLLEATRGQLARRWRRASALRMLGHTGCWPRCCRRPERVELAADLLSIGQAKSIAALLATPVAQRLLPRFARQGLAMTPH